MGGGRPLPGKMMGGFAKMLADKLKMPPSGGMRKPGGGGSSKTDSNPPIVENNVDVVKLLEEQPFKGKTNKKKPAKKVFLDE